MIILKRALFHLWFVLVISRAQHHSHIHSRHSSDVPTRNVAVIGAGAGGASAAFHLNRYAIESGINTKITIFERNSYIGGRTTTVHAWGHPSVPVELGGSIFVEVNKILVSAVKQFNLSISEPYDLATSSDAPDLGIWNGNEFILTQNSETGWWDIAKLLWRYGLAPIKTMRLMRDTVGKFLKMYEEPYFPWSSLTDVAYELGLTAVTSSTGQQFLKANNIGDLFANEVVQASTRVNYAQNLALIHGLEAMVCMAANGAMSVAGGNWKIFDNMIHEATSDVRLNTSVISLMRQDNGSYVLRSKTFNKDASSSSSTIDENIFDDVILAAPHQFSQIEISPRAKYMPDKVPYVLLHVTLFASPHALSPEAFNLPSDAQVPQTILTTLQKGEDLGSDPKGVGAAGFFSISTLRSERNPTSIPPGRPEFLYKIFSPARVNSTSLAKILGIPLLASQNDEISKGDISWIHRKIWHSYPLEYPRVTFEEIQLDDNLWYTSGIENFISTMETSALMGKNVAKLIVNGWEKSHRTNKDTIQQVIADDFIPMQKPLKERL